MMNSTTTTAAATTNNIIINDDDTNKKVFEYDEKRHTENLMYIYDSFNEYSKNICDRRLSRAARTLLKKHILRASAIFHQQQQQQQQQQQEIYIENDIIINDDDDHDDDIWSLLDDMIGKADTTSTCPLIPSKDIFRHDEEHTTKTKPTLQHNNQLNWAYPAHTIQQRKNNNNYNYNYYHNNNKNRRQQQQQKYNWWYHCGYCGKVFSSQYYLDIHMHTHHNHHHHQQQHSEDNKEISSSSSSIKNNAIICPAIDWCKIVGLANCHEQALFDEPYYGRGSGGWGDDGKFIEHKWRKEAHSVSCNLAKMKQDCLLVLSSCAVTIANEIFCNNLECPTHHFWESLSDSIYYLPDHHHYYYETWIKEAKNHKGFTLLVFILVFGCVFYFSEIDIFPNFWTTTGRKTMGNSSNNNHNKERRRSRLLQKNSSPRSRLSSSSFFNHQQQRNQLLRSKGSKIH